MTLVTGAFAYLQQLVLDRSAIVLADDKEYLVESRLHPIARELGLDRADAVIDRVRLTRNRALEDRVVEAMTTNETYWFRDVHPWTALRRTVLPEIIARRTPSRRLSVWSAACSSGQEAYSLAMLIADEFPRLRDWDVRILGTDLSSGMIARAEDGCYSALEVGRGLPESMLARHFTCDGSRYRVDEAIRRRTRFRQLNLAGPWPAMPRYDLILIRNVLIYFDLPVRQRILAAAAVSLEPDGYLLVGASETMMGVTDLFRPHSADGATFYRLEGRS